MTNHARDGFEYLSHMWKLSFIESFYARAAHRCAVWAKNEVKRKRTSRKRHISARYPTFSCLFLCSFPTSSHASLTWWWFLHNIIWYRYTSYPCHTMTGASKLTEEKKERSEEKVVVVCQDDVEASISNYLQEVSMRKMFY